MTLMHATNATSAARLHVIDTSYRMGSWAQKVRDAFDPAVAAVCRLLPVEQVDVVAYASDNVIPELGMNAYTEHQSLVRMWLDPAHPKLEPSFDRTFPGLLAHELHHAARQRGPGYGHTLGDALVSEGLACQFEREVTTYLPVYGAEFDARDLPAQMARIAPFLDRAFSPAWMFGSEAEGIERSFGYRLGSTLVTHWLQAHGTTAAKAVHVPTKEVLLAPHAGNAMLPE